MSLATTPAGPANKYIRKNRTYSRDRNEGISERFHRSLCSQPNWKRGRLQARADSISASYIYAFVYSFTSWNPPINGRFKFGSHLRWARRDDMITQTASVHFRCHSLLSCLKRGWPHWSQVVVERTSNTKKQAIDVGIRTFRN